MKENKKWIGLKVWPEYFEDLMGGKNFEIRKNDRNFKVEDCLILREWDNLTGRYTGRILSRRVTYIFDFSSDPFNSLSENFCVMGLEKI